MVNGRGVRKENTSGGHEKSMGEVDLLDSECLQFASRRGASTLFRIKTCKKLYRMTLTLQNSLFHC